MNDNIIELLAPAGTAQIGCAAIDAGADAVYLGAELFSARAAAGNSIEDIAMLCRYAHRFGAKVYLALNTLIDSDAELETARLLALEAIDAGIDAIIFQDVRLLDMGLPIQMHASTQTFNFTAEKVAQLQRAGCSRVVLERGLSIDEIRSISRSVDVELEVFIHGAICVGYSGICGLSEHLTSRSGNKGQCAQPCRSNYDLLDAAGRVLIANEALLSPRDMNLSARIAELIDAGVCSLKIEGRLKERDYVQNVVAAYHTILRQLGVRRSSRGVVHHHFTPDVRLSFNRGFTEWFFDGVTADKRLFATAVPPGQPIGRIISIDDKSITVDLPNDLRNDLCNDLSNNLRNDLRNDLPNDLKISNGDGICFRSSDRTIKGVRVNRVQGNQLHLLSTDGLTKSMELYRNFAIDFHPSSERRIEIDITLDNHQLTATDDSGYQATVAMPENMEVATNVARATEMLRSSLIKSGGTIFTVRSVKIDCRDVPFITSATINSLRRQLLDSLESSYIQNHRTSHRPTSSATLTNEMPDFLMRTRYCILREKGMCLKTTKLNTPLSLGNNNRTIELKFDCGACEMLLVKN